MEDRSRQLLRGGALLCFLALVTGLAIPAFANPRMGLSAHVGGLMNGMFLLIVGLAWNQLELSDRIRGVAFWALVVGAFGNWASVVAASVWGTATLTPIAGSGFGADRWKEAVVAVGLVCVGVTMLAGTLSLVVGLRKR